MAKQTALATACPCDLLLLAVFAFQARFQKLDLVTLQAIELGGIVLDLPLEAEIGT